MKVGDVVMILRDDVPGTNGRWTGYLGMLGIVGWVEESPFEQQTARVSSGFLMCWDWDESELEVLEAAR